LMSGQNDVSSPHRSRLLQQPKSAISQHGIVCHSWFDLAWQPDETSATQEDCDWVSLDLVLTEHEIIDVRAM
jgi:hypothetical protein